MARLVIWDAIAPIMTSQQCPSVTQSREIQFSHNVLLSRQIVLKILHRARQYTAVLCENFQRDLTTTIDVLDERDFASTEFKISFWQISYTETASRLQAVNAFHWTGTSTLQMNYGADIIITSMIDYGMQLLIHAITSAVVELNHIGYRAWINNYIHQTIWT